MNDTFKAQGEFTIEVIRDGKNGPQVIQRRHVPNLVINGGRRQLLRMAGGLQTNLFDQIRIGTCGATPTGSQTNVLSPVTGTIRTASNITMLSGTRTMQWIVSYQSGAGTKSATNIKEISLLNQHTSPGGTAMSRATFSAVSKTTADKMKITYRCRLT